MFGRKGLTTKCAGKCCREQHVEVGAWRDSAQVISGQGVTRRQQAGRCWGWEWPEAPSSQGYSSVVSRCSRAADGLGAPARNMRGVGQPGCRGRQSINSVLREMSELPWAAMWSVGMGEQEGWQSPGEKGFGRCVRCGKDA